MSKMTEVIRSEIVRLARKEVKQSALPLARGLTGLRRGVSKILQALTALEKKVDRQNLALRSTPTLGAPVQAAEGEESKSRLSPGLLKKLRKRLDISQTGLAQLLAVSQPAVASWEQGRAKPGAANRAAIVALRALSPAQVSERLAASQAASRKTAKRPAKRSPRGKRR